MESLPATPPILLSPSSPHNLSTQFLLMQTFQVPLSAVMDQNWSELMVRHQTPKEIKEKSMLYFYPGHGIPPLLKAITSLLPLDAYVPCPVSKIKTHGCLKNSHQLFITLLWSPRAARLVHWIQSWKWDSPEMRLLPLNQGWPVVVRQTCRSHPLSTHTLSHSRLL